MVSFTVATGIALLASVVAAIPTREGLVARQATMPEKCSDYCSDAVVNCVCIKRPTNCVATYMSKAGETCSSIVSQYNNFTAHDLLAWNPEIGQECVGLLAFVPVCIGVPGYTFPGAVKAGDIWTAEQIPVPVQPGIVTNCKKFEYTDASGRPGLEAMLTEHGITREQWNRWNNGSLWAQYFSCVEA